MTMVCGLDLHRQQITFDGMGLFPCRGRCGEDQRWQPDRERVRRWLRHNVGPAGEGRSGGGGGGGLRRVALRGGGDRGGRVRGTRRRARADTGAARGPQASGKDRPLRHRGCCPPGCRARRAPRVVGFTPTAVLEWRERVRLYKSLIESTPGMDPADPRRAVPARRRRARRPVRTPSTRAWLAGNDVALTTAARQRMPDRLHDDRRHRRRSGAVEGAVDSLRDASAGVPGAGRQPVCGSAACWRWRCKVARRLSTLLWFQTRPCATPGCRRPHGLPRICATPSGSCPARVRRRCSGRCSKRRRERLPLGQPLLRLLRRHEEPAATASWRRSPSPASAPAAATRSCATSTPTSSTRRPRPDHRRGRQPGSLKSTSGCSAGVSSCHTHARRPSGWTAL